MYSRNTRNGRRSSSSNSNGVNTAPAEIKANENDMVNLPEPPPNYRGMLYEPDIPSENNAEGIDRLVREDESYKQYEKNIRRRDYMQNMPSEPPNDDAEVFARKTDDNGLRRLIDGLSGKSFLPEDILICAMIILMLNSSSEDDILMVLVLMMLL